MALDPSNILAELAGFNNDKVQQDPEVYAKILQAFVNEGSQLHNLHVDDITVFFNPSGDVADVEKDNVRTIDGKKVANTVSGLLAAGAKFFDAVLYLSLPEDRRPQPSNHQEPKKSGQIIKFPLYNDVGLITQYIFSMYFFIMIRAHPPSNLADYKAQPMPKFISAVLGIEQAAAAMAEYLASFSLSNLNPAWVKYIDVKGLSQEAASRFGLGVAGYRIVSIFNVIIPDKYRTTKKGEPILEHEKDAIPLEEKPAWLDDAIKVAKSFKDAGPCWDFHPATRNPNVLSKYGNINKNATNLLLASYSAPTVQKMVQTKKLAVPPVGDASYTEYLQWGGKGEYVATSKIFH